jgi:hypothetical protein
MRVAAALGKPPHFDAMAVAPLLQEMPAWVVREGSTVHQALKGAKPEARGKPLFVLSSLLSVSSA